MPLHQVPNLADWERQDVLPTGERVLVRPLRPEDAKYYPDFIVHVTADDSRLRFFSTIRELSDERIEAFTRLDYTRAMAFIAIDETADTMLGVVRLHFDNNDKAGEYAVIVRSQLKGHGLGWLLMKRMIEYAKAIGLLRVHGQVLTENSTMLRMCAELGFHMSDDPSSRDIKVVTLDLEEDGKTDQ